MSALARTDTTATGTGWYGVADQRTAHVLNAWQERLRVAPDTVLAAAAARAETLPGHGTADLIRHLVDEVVELRIATDPTFLTRLRRAVEELDRD